VVQERADETAVVAAAFRVRVVSPDESTTALVVSRVVQGSNRSESTAETRAA
jgi:hypothetical protein